MKIGYARVSKLEQNLDLQKDALLNYGCQEVIHDSISGSTTQRDGLNRLLTMIRKGDEVVVWRLDRLGRNLAHLIELVNLFNSKEVTFISLTENIETKTTGGKLVFNIFASLAEFEKNIIKERTIAGLEAARARGKVGGRPTKDKNKINAAIQLYNKKELSVDNICKVTGVSKGTLYKYIHLKDKKQ